MAELIYRRAGGPLIESARRVLNNTAAILACNQGARLARHKRRELQLGPCGRCKGSTLRTHVAVPGFITGVATRFLDVSGRHKTGPTATGLQCERLARQPPY